MFADSPASSGVRPRLLSLAPSGGGSGLQGPSIRTLEMASALSHKCDVLLAADTRQHGRFESLMTISRKRRAVLAGSRGCDAVLAAWIPPYLLPGLILAGKLAVADLYDPVERELVFLETDSAAAVERSRALTDIQIRHADLLVCAGDRQRDDTRSRLESVGRAQVPVLVVPFGLTVPQPTQGPGPIRKRFEFDDEDDVIVWWGSAWRWFDPQTAIEAMALLSERRPSAKLVFSAGLPPDADTHKLLSWDPARRLAARLGLLDRTVFFFDDWVDYECRHEFLADADVGLTLHLDDREARLAIRARFSDYLACALPCVVSSGDEVGESLAAAGMAKAVTAGNPGEAASALDALLQPVPLERARKQARELRELHRWERAVEPLAAALLDRRSRVAATRSHRRRRAGRAAIAATAYYARGLS